jgi:ribonuclease HIII
MPPILPIERASDLRRFLEDRGYHFEDRPHQLFLAKGRDTVVNLYANGKVVIGGSRPEERAVVLGFLDSIGASPSARSPSHSPEILDLDFHQTRVGMDEAGKGDYFGPLVACGVLATEFQAEKMRAEGVRDSKDLGTPAVKELASWLRDKALERGQWRIVSIPPARYNLLILRMGNLNRLLGWAHARALEDVLKFNEPCSLAIADQFGDPKFIEGALMANGKQVRLVQTPKGERDVVVAAASILARDGFLTAIETMDRGFGEKFPLGASQVEDFARSFVAKHGEVALLDTAKVHFATTTRVLGSDSRLQQELATREAADKVRPSSRQSLG